MSDIIKSIAVSLGENPNKPYVRYTEDMIAKAYARNVSNLVTVFPQKFVMQRMVKLSAGMWQDVGKCFYRITELLSQNDKDGNVIKTLNESSSKDMRPISSKCDTSSEGFRLNSYYIERHGSTMFQVSPAVPCDTDVWVTVLGVLNIDEMVKKIKVNNANANREYDYYLDIPGDMEGLIWLGTMADLLNTNINSAVAYNEAKLYYDRYDVTLKYMQVADSKARGGR